MNTWLSMHLIYVAPLNIVSTRMHSSRMRTARSSSRPGGLHQAPPGTRHPSRDQAPPWDQIPFRTRHTLQRRPPSRPGTPPGADPPGPGTPPVDRHTPVNILPCPKLRLRAVKALATFTCISKASQWYLFCG